jgi:hypothetical protein
LISTETPNFCILLRFQDPVVPKTSFKGVQVDQTSMSASGATYEFDGLPELPKKTFNGFPIAVTFCLFVAVFSWEFLRHLDPSIQAAT